MSAVEQVLGRSQTTGETKPVNTPSLNATGLLGVGAKTGFLPIPTSAAAPTGVPADMPSGYLAICYCTGDNKLYVYDGAWVASAALA